MDYYEILESVLSFDPAMVSCFSVLGGLCFTAVVAVKLGMAAACRSYAVARWAFSGAKPGKLAENILAQLREKATCDNASATVGNLRVCPYTNPLSVYVNDRQVFLVLTPAETRQIVRAARALIEAHRDDMKQLEEEMILLELAVPTEKPSGDNKTVRR